MRILILDNEFPPLGGGTGVVNYYLMKEFDSQGIECDLVTSSRTKNTYEIETFGKRCRIFKVPVNNKNIHHSSNIELIRYSFKGFWQAYKLYRQQKYQVCLAFAGVPAGAIALAMKKLVNLPYIVSLQGPDVPCFEQRYARLYPFLLPLIKSVWVNAEYVTATSQEHKNLSLRTIPWLPIEVIPNGVHNNNKVGRPRKEAGDPLVVVCVGRLIQRKGQHHLINAIDLFRKRSQAGEIRAYLIGTGDMEDKLHRQCKELGLDEVVNFTGFLSRETIADYYQNADVFVLPSFNEGMSIALLEAMSHGLPVIVTDTGGTGELVKGNGFVVPWSDSVAIADALAVYHDQPSIAQKHGKQSREIAMKYGWASAANAYLKLCSQVISNQVNVDDHEHVLG